MTDSPPIKIYVNKIENSLTFKIKTGYYPKLLIHETIKLLRSTKNKIAKDENGENVPNLEITEVVLVHSNIAENDYEYDSTVLCTLVPNKSFGQLLDILLKNFLNKLLIQSFYILKLFQNILINIDQNLNC